MMVLGPPLHSVHFRKCCRYWELINEPTCWSDDKDYWTGLSKLFAFPTFSHCKVVHITNTYAFLQDALCVEARALNMHGAEDRV